VQFGPAVRGTWLAEVPARAAVAGIKIADARSIVPAAIQDSGLDDIWLLL
jgi:hypothetical protein